MADNLQYRLNNYKQDPPPGAWKDIAARLSTEFNSVENKVADTVSGISIVPPRGNWSAIASVLDAADQVKENIPQSTGAPVIDMHDTTGRRGARIPFRSVAAVLVVVLAVGTAWYLNRNARRQLVQPLVTVGTTPSTVAEQNAQPNEMDAVQLAAAVPGFRVAKNSSTPKSRRNTSFAIAGRQPGIVSSEADKDIRYASVETAEKTERDPITVPNNPIRDANGNIIMDEKLVSSPDKNYVTVTGPNGEQTRISKKFMHALSYMNSATTDEDYLELLMHEGSLWKWLFQEWRTKLIKQPSFIPTATNFLDIMELKEILHENF